MLRLACSFFPLLLLASATHAASVCDGGAPLVTVTPGNPAPSTASIGLELCVGADFLERPTEVSIDGNEILVAVFAAFTPLAIVDPSRRIFEGIELGPLPSGTYEYTISMTLFWPTIDGRIPHEPFVAEEGAFTVAPEPRTAALACLGLTLLAIGGRDRRKHSLAS